MALGKNILLLQTELLRVNLCEMIMIIVHELLLSVPNSCCRVPIWGPSPKYMESRSNEPNTI